MGGCLKRWLLSQILSQILSDYASAKTAIHSSGGRDEMGAEGPEERAEQSRAEQRGRSPEDSGTGEGKEGKGDAASLLMANCTRVAPC